MTDWYTLGTVYVIDGQLTVSLTEALVNKYVVADAVRIELDTNPSSKLIIRLDDSSVSEAGALSGKVIRTGDPAGSLTVNLASDNTACGHRTSIGGHCRWRALWHVCDYPDR